jgi:hypothetical protein
MMTLRHVLGDVADQMPLEAFLAGIRFRGPMAAKPPAPVVEGSRDRLLQGRLVAGPETGDPGVVARPEAVVPTSPAARFVVRISAGLRDINGHIMSAGLQILVPPLPLATHG